MTTEQKPNEYERMRHAQRPVMGLIYTGRYSEAMAAIRAQFCGEDETAVPERFDFDLDTWLHDVVGAVRKPEGRSAFIRELLTLTDKDPMRAFWRVANTNGVQPDVFPDLVDILRADLNREVALYVTPGLSLSTREGSDFMVGPLWLVLLLCVCRPSRSGSLGVLAYKKSFSEEDLAWIDQAAALAAKHGADLGLCKTVTWKRSKPVQQAMVANIEARHLRQAVDAIPADQAEPIRALVRARL
ncbi:protease [Burkholderia vietnamiensis]|uniref:protease n=1 Tax=Burkholderia vietnamiensis TaxID=60552 RepID=UPI001CF33FF3|nr:protease [Burkholderia vietnamiensis]MCA8148106.1 protease [Burkholderia vietnamiensis]